MHISNHKNQETYSKSLSNLGSFKFLAFTTKGLLFYSLPISKILQWVGTFLIPTRDFWGRRTIKENYSFFLLYASHNSLIFSAKDVFTLVCNQMTIFQRLVIWREKTLMGSLGSYEKIIGLRYFNWARRWT